ncbi:MAG: prepilin-type N-terminal cleavage/methylation domain-containing protein [Roseibacillus sp.]
MKLTNTKTNKSNKGMTLIELTVVILVLLSLISVLFIGARAWMRGSDRANAALLIRNAQQGVRSHSNIMGLDTGAVDITYSAAWTAAGNEGTAGVLQEEVFGPQKYVETENLGDLPVHPDSAESFVAGASDFETIPALGTPYMTSAETGDETAEFYLPKNIQ